MLAAVHMREHTTMPLMVRQVRGMLDRRVSGKTALNDVCIQSIPMANSDGVQISQHVLDDLNDADSR